MLTFLLPQHDDFQDSYHFINERNEDEKSALCRSFQLKNLLRSPLYMPREKLIGSESAHKCSLRNEFQEMNENLRLFVNVQQQLLICTLNY
jgi:hypothetical protein